MFFESEHICTNCGEKKGFHVYESSKGEILRFSTKYGKAQDWRIKGGKVCVTLKCDKCWETSESYYTLDGKYIGEKDE